MRGEDQRKESAHGWVLIGGPGVTASARQNDRSQLGLLVVDGCDSENLVAENTMIVTVA